MLDLLLPPTVSLVETFSDATDPYLYPEERAAVAKAVAKRVNEFATVRHCARQAMAALGLPPAPIVPGERGAPTWPAGVVGAMTHCDGYRAAALAFAREVRTIGIDAEPNGPLPDDVLDLVSLPAEREQLRRLAGTGDGICWDRLLFCAKESTYKAWFPLTRQWLGFEEAVVTFDPDARTFAVDILRPRPARDGVAVTGFEGRWTATADLLATTIVEPAPSSS